MEKLLEIINVDEKPPTHLYQNMNIKRLQRDLINLNSKINDYEIYIGKNYCLVKFKYKDVFCLNNSYLFIINIITLYIYIFFFFFFFFFFFL